jgi:MFS family permease
VFGYLAFGLICIGFTYFTSVIQIACMFALFGLAVAVVETVPRAYVSEMTDQKHEGTLLGMYHTASGIVALPASLFAGLIWQFFGSSMAFYYGAGLSFLAAFFFIVAMNSKA